MDAVAAFLDDLADLIEAVIGRVVGFERTAGNETGADDRKHDSVEKVAVLGVKRAVDEDVAVHTTCHADYLLICGSAAWPDTPLRSCSIVALISFDVKCVGFVFGDRMVTPSESFPAALYGAGALFDLVVVAMALLFVMVLI